MNQETEKGSPITYLSNYGMIVANHIEAMMAYWDANLLCRFANKAYGQWFGKTPEEMIDKITLSELLGPTLYEKNLPYIKGALDGKVQNFERTLTMPSGKVRHTLASYYPHIIDGKIKGFIVHVADISEIKTLEFELKESLQREKELNEMKTRFVSIASHEFRTPLTTILSSVDLIEHYVRDEEQQMRRKHIERIKSEVNNLNNILNDFLSIDKIEQGKIVVVPVQFDLKEFISQVIENFKGTTKPGQSIFYRHQGSDSVILDKNDLNYVMLNLISNAIKYSEADIEVNVIVDAKKVIISVADQGIGIPEEEQKEIFTRFFRAKNVGYVQGTGLGLNIVKRYIEIMGGTIEFASQKNVGTTFIVHLPQKEKHIEKEFIEDLRKRSTSLK
jgi:PAS domain S-box-containing protein